VNVPVGPVTKEGFVTGVKVVTMAMDVNKNVHVSEVLVITLPVVVLVRRVTLEKGIKINRYPCISLNNIVH